MQRTDLISRIASFTRIGLSLALLASIVLTHAGCRNAASPRRVASTGVKAARMADATDAKSSKSRRPAEISHFVFVKLNDPALADELVAECDRELGDLPMVIAFACGRPLDTGRGERIDSDYDVGMYMAFRNEADYTAYVEHPQHVALISKWKPRWKWIRIQDVLDESP